MDKGAIDFKAMYAAEKKKMQQSTKIMQTTRETVFNLLQDMRHLLVLDIRPKEDFAKSRIRGSFSFTLEDVESKIPDFMKFWKRSQDKLLDKTDKLRRLLIITQDAGEDIDSIKPLLQDAEAFNKVMQLKNGFGDFHDKYSFLCVSDESDSDDVKRAEARYPSEIIPNKLFLGNFINSLNENHFKWLNIRKLIGMTPTKAEKMDESEQIDTYVHLEMNELHKPDLDFESLQSLLVTTMSEGDGAVLIYCLQGNLSAAVWIHMLMQEKKWPREFAAAAVMSKRPEIKNIPNWLFGQIDAPKFGDVPAHIINQILK
jgi:rhodanese-related sulfurtransferase